MVELLLPKQVARVRFSPIAQKFDISIILCIITNGTQEEGWPERRIVMYHNNSSVQEFTNMQCPHGMCLNHSPEWKNVGLRRYEPNPTPIKLFGLTIFMFLTYRVSYYYNESTLCCGKKMSRYKEVQDQRCNKCGRNVVQVLNFMVALCLCCGRTKDVRLSAYAK